MNSGKNTYWELDTTLIIISSKKKNWAFVLPSLLKLIRALPYYKETKRGRSRKKQIQIILLIIGIISIVFGKSLVITIVGIGLCILAFAIPISIHTRRRWIMNLKTKSVIRVKKQEPISISMSQQKVNLKSETLNINIKRKKPRKVLHDGYIYVGFRDSTLDSRVWFRAEDSSASGSSFQKKEKVDFIIDISHEKVLELAK